MNESVHFIKEGNPDTHIVFVNSTHDALNFNPDDYFLNQKKNESQLNK